MEFFSTINAFYVIVGSALLGASAGMLGVFAVLRRQGLLGDALAHASLPGIAFAFLIMKTKFLPGLLLGALISALLAAFLINLLVSKSKIKMDSAMAGILSVFFGLGIFVLTYIQHLPISAQAGLDSFLFGQAAALLKDDVVFMSLAFLFIFLVIVIFWKELKLFIFDADYAKVLGFKKYFLEFLFMSIFVLAILMSLQAVGVVLTAALFIIPAVTALFWVKDLFWAVLLSAFLGMFSGTSGAYVSSVYEKMPTGPVIVLIATSVFLISFLFSPNKGLIYRFYLNRQASLKIEMENVLGKFCRDVATKNGVWLLDEYKAYGYKMSVLRRLKRLGLVDFFDEEIRFTKAGKERAVDIVEKHRLWETYLVHELKVQPDHVHRDAESMEHILTDEMIVKLKKILNNPKVDPHGKPIKQKL